MTGALLLTLLAAEPIKVGAPGLQVINLPPQMTTFYTASLSQQLNYAGVRMVTAADLGAVLGFERQQQLLGCPDDLCKAKVSTDLGFDGLLVGQVTKLDSTLQLDVKILEVGSGRTLAAATSNAPDQDRLVANLNNVAVELARQLSTSLGRPLGPSDSSRVVKKWSTVKRLGFLPTVLFAGGLGASVALLTLARGSYDQLERTRDPSASPGQPNAPLTPDQAAALVNAGRGYQTGGWISVGLAAAFAATAVVMFLFGGDEVLSSGVASAPSPLSIGRTGVSW